MKCEHLTDSTCLVVYRHTGIPYVPESLACHACAKQIPPKRWNTVTIGLSLGVLKTAKSPHFDAKFREWQPLLQLFFNRQPKQAQAGIVGRAKRYATALARWVAAGRPERSQAEVDKCFAICVSCEHYSGTSCKICGCKVSQSAIALVNKIKMATEVCPKEKWS